MGIWNKIGKVALTAAPYVAAPFTGGASLLATPATQAAVRKWSASDAQKNAAKGIGPSKFDKYLGLAGDVGSMVAPTGAFGALGKAAQLGKAASTASKIGKIATIGNAAMAGIGAAAAIKGAGAGPDSTPSYAPGTNTTGGGSLGLKTNAGDRSRGIGPTMPKGGFSYQNAPLNQYDQSSPNLSLALHQGRQLALKNQPWRSGYDVTEPNEDTTLPPKIVGTMPPIYPNLGGKNRKRQPQAGNGY